MLDDPHFLHSIGISLTGHPVPIPLYTRRRMIQVSNSGHDIMRVVPVDDSLQEAVRLVIQIVDGTRFRR
jgi:hypothetical protein